MHGAFGQMILAVVFIGGGGFALLSQVARIRESGSGLAGRSGRLSKTAPYLRVRHIRAAAKAEAHTIWEKTRAADWGKQRDHERAAAAKNGGVTAAAQSRKNGVTEKLAKLTAIGRSSGNGTVPPSHVADGAKPKVAAPPSSVPGGNGTMAAGTSTASAEKLIEGTTQIQAEAASGGIHAKHAAIKACNEGAIRFSSMLQMMARAMSEPGSNYGSEITEPMAKAATHMQAAGMAVGEADAALTTLLSMTVGDLAASSRQAPHHSELTESGAH